MKEEYNASDILSNIIMNSSEGQKIELQDTDVSIVYLSDPMYFILPSNASKDEILVEVEHNILAQLVGQEKLKILLEKFNDKLNSVVAFESTFLKKITISGNVIKILNPITLEKDINVIKANLLTRSINSNWKRGYLLFKGNDKSYLQINEGLRERIAKGLQSYVHTNIFGFLTREVYSQFLGKNEKLYAIIECKKCKNIEIYHAFEIANRLCDSRYCRKCSGSRYKNLMEVPFSDTFLIDIFTDFNIFFDEYMHKNKVPPDWLIEKLLRFSKLDHQLEIGVVYDFLRNKYKERFQKSKFEIMIKLEKIIGQAEKNSTRFQEFLQYDEKFSTMQSFQTTTDISMIYNNIFKNENKKLLEFHYPNPITTVESDDFIISEINDVDFNSIINLYKDTFDLIGDHWFLANLAKVIKNSPIIEDCITADLYGANLLSKILRLTKKTDLHDIIEDIYNVKIRNAIAHPGRVIDKANNEIKIYDKGELIETYKINDFLLNVEKLINFHIELTYVKYRLAMKKDTGFLMTGGLLSFQPEFYTKPGENEKPHLVINQLAQFKDYNNKKLDFWSKNIKIEKVGNSEAIRFYIKRNKSNYFEAPEIREAVWGLSNHIKEWLEMALKEEEIIVTHRYCYIPVDISSGEKDLQWIPIKIPIYPLEEEKEVFIKSMSECGKITITDNLRRQFENLLSHGGA